MSTAINTGTGNIPLRFARKLAQKVNEAWEEGEFLSKTTGVTSDLLRFWFNDSFCDTRNYNFHIGQRQAILNTIYLHEILKVENVFDNYVDINEELLGQMNLTYLSEEKFNHPKYCMKMATGTGKTWVMNALLIWQFLNAKFDETNEGRYSKNFLLVSPGLIVYERLLDAYLGKEDESGVRDFDSSDFRKYESLFIPPAYKEAVFGFIQSNVVKKDEIGRKITGEGMIAITNWHLLAGVEEEYDDLDISPLEDPSRIVRELLPITPGKTQGHDISSLDNRFLGGGEIDFLAELENIVVFNDEAHHIHETKKAGIVSEVEWQKSLNKISENKGNSFIQIDFSATPYDVSGSGQKRKKHYFPHIIVDFDLRTAIYNGLVKAITIDRRKELATVDLDFKAVREGRSVVGLSDGQKLMLRAGLKKLKILEEQFVEISKDKYGVSSKHPKMLVVCEDTKVSPFVEDFLVTSEDLSEKDVVRIDSDRKGSIRAKEWDTIKQRLFNIDQHTQPKVIVSVLMLREGFDVNNICVIVPLRSTQAPILLEQTIGRGLRLMWREPEYKEMKRENIKNMLQKKEAPDNYLDILSIVEHPAFLEFYDSLIKDGMIIEDDNELNEVGEKSKGDIIRVGLKDNYEKYDLFIPIIISEKEERLALEDLTEEDLAEFRFYKLEKLKKFIPKKGETFFSEEITVKTTFGEYRVTADLFTARSYNEYLAKLANIITNSITRIDRRSKNFYPFMQVNLASLVGLLDNFIRNRLFGQSFNPLEDNNWRILMLSEQGITNHIIKEVSKKMYEMQNNIKVDEAVIAKRYFSEIEELKMRENYSLEIVKTIYERLPYPSVKGGFEKNFMLACDRDTQVKAIMKINEYYHSFARLNYIRTDGMLASYYPDFMIKFNDSVYLVETKACKNLESGNVIQKELAAVDWIKKVNELNHNDRDNVEWNYVLLGEKTFYVMQEKGIWIKEILEYSKLTREKVERTLF